MNGAVWQADLLKQPHRLAFGFKNWHTASMKITPVFLSLCVLCSQSLLAQAQTTAPAETAPAAEQTAQEAAPAEQAELVEKTPFELMLEKAQAEDADVQLKYDVALAYYHGRGVEKNLEQAFEWFNEAATAGHLRAQNSLALCYAKGLGTQADSAKAVQWFEKAAEAGYEPSQITLANLYQYGQWVKKSDAKALKWFEKSAEQGNAESQLTVAQWYAEGKGAPKNEAVAFKWYEKLIDESAEAREAVLKAYALGKGVEKSEARAREQMQKLLEQDPFAVGRIFQELENADGFLPFDDATTFQWYQLASDKNVGYAHSKLAQCYENGKGVASDLEKAKQWRQAAKRNGYFELK